VWALARFLGVPEVIVSKPASADLIEGQTDEGDFGISYARADEILNWLVNGYSPSDIVAQGFDQAEVELVRSRLAGLIGSGSFPLWRWSPQCDRGIVPSACRLLIRDSYM